MNETGENGIWGRNCSWSAGSAKLEKTPAPRNRRARRTQCEEAALGANNRSSRTRCASNGSPDDLPRNLRVASRCPRPYAV